MPAKRQNKGFTLIELLVSMVLMTIIMFVASLSFSLFSELWGKKLGSFNQTADKAIHRYMLHDVIEGISNYPVSNGNDAVYLFRGNASEMEFITHQPVFVSDSMAKIRLSIQTGEKGQQQLVYQEAPFTQGIIASLNDELPYLHQVVLFDGTDIRFNYRGWQSFEQRVAFWDGDGKQITWSSEYDAADIGMLPYGINIIWGENEPIIFPIQHDNGYQLTYTHEKRSGG